MKRLITILLILAGTSSAIFAQQATVKVEFLDIEKPKFRISVPKYSLGSVSLKQSKEKINIDHNNSKFTIQLTEPLFVTMNYQHPKDENLTISYLFYLSPNDELDFKANLSNQSQISVTGKGDQNNQPLLANMKGLEIYTMYKDSIPNKAIAKINEEDKRRKDALKEYLKKYKPTKAFINDWNNEINYYTASTYYSVKENSKFGENGAAYKRNYPLWAKIQDSIFSQISLNNEFAINAPQYQKLINNFLLREKERIWKDISENPVETLKTWYNADSAVGMQLFIDDRTNLLQEKILNKYFTDKAADLAYANLFESAIRESDPTNLVKIYSRYKSNHPKSAYAPLFEGKIEEIAKKERQVLTNKMVILPNNGYEINSFDEVLAMFKGKTVLLDMWGTWCGPCREEIEKNGEKIKLALKDKGIDYLYIANYDDKSEKKWKELITYFKLEGTHILANKKLTDDIMTKTKGQGYPTYVVIKKDGTYALSEAGYPMDREVLVKQLLEAANLNF